jgi:DNA-binding response OmpR family regulator
MKILLVEDDFAIAQNLCLLLTKAGYVVNISETVEDSVTEIQTSDYDLLICDRRLSDGDGIEVVKSARVNGQTIPILMLTAKTAKGDVVEGLNEGADDYLPKPFDSEVLLARVRALLRRRSSQALSPVVQIGEVSVDTNTRIVKRKNKIVELSPKEYGLLEYLIANKDRIVERVEILTHVWDDEVDLFSNTVDVHVRYLRAKLGSQIVSTIRGKGYRLCTQE